jgi:hypothetical protein
MMSLRKLEILFRMPVGKDAPRDSESKPIKDKFEKYRIILPAPVLAINESTRKREILRVLKGFPCITIRFSLMGNGFPNRFIQLQRVLKEFLSGAIQFSPVGNGFPNRSIQLQRVLKEFLSGAMQFSPVGKVFPNRSIQL